MFISCREAYLGKKPLKKYSCEYYPISLDRMTFNPQLLEDVDKKFLDLKLNQVFWKNLVRVEEDNRGYSVSRTTIPRTCFDVRTQAKVMYMPSKELLVWFKGSSVTDDFVKEIMDKLCAVDMDFFNDKPSGELNDII